MSVVTFPSQAANLGQEVYTQDFGVVSSELRVPFNLSKQKEGLYLVRVQTDNEVKSEQIILTR